MKTLSPSQENKKKEDARIFQNHLTTARGYLINNGDTDSYTYGFNELAFWIPSKQQWITSEQDFSVTASDYYEAKQIFFDKFKSYINRRFKLNYVNIEYLWNQPQHIAYSDIATTSLLSKTLMANVEQLAFNQEYDRGNHKNLIAGSLHTRTQNPTSLIHLKTWWTNLMANSHEPCSTNLYLHHQSLRNLHRRLFPQSKFPLPCYLSCHGGGSK